MRIYSCFHFEENPCQTGVVPNRSDSGAVSFPNYVGRVSHARGASKFLWSFVFGFWAKLTMTSRFKAIGQSIAHLTRVSFVYRVLDLCRGTCVV